MLNLRCKTACINRAYTSLNANWTSIIIKCMRSYTSDVAWHGLTSTFNLYRGPLLSTLYHLRIGIAISFESSAFVSPTMWPLSSPHCSNDHAGLPHGGDYHFFYRGSLNAALSRLPSVSDLWADTWMRARSIPASTTSHSNRPTTFRRTTYPEFQRVLCT